VLLLGVLDGGLDADAAFFSREIRGSGDTETVVSLHNTLEAAALSPSDLLGAPAWLRGVADAAARGALSWGQARRTS
jgi:predicted lipid carrier protein YhbT